MFSKITILRSVFSSSSRTSNLVPEYTKHLKSACNLYSTSQTYNIRKIEINEDADSKSGKKSISIEGVVSDLPKENLILSSYSSANGCKSASEKCHPLCRFSAVHEIKHTDVLILKQFIDHKGEMISREITGLCRRQHQRMSKLIKMSAKAGLLPLNLDQFREEKTKNPWAKLNSYWDESTIDIQWLEKKRKDKLKSFKE